MYRFLRKFRRFLAARRGGVLIEVGMAAPILVIFLISAFDTARFVLINQKVQRTAMTAADLAARTQTMDQNDLNNLFAAADEVSRPYAVLDKGRVIVSSVVGQQNGEVRVGWQRTGGALTDQSHIGHEGELAEISEPHMVDNELSVIVAEVFYEFEPIFLGIPEAQTLYHQATFRPRLSRQVELE